MPDRFRYRGIWAARIQAQTALTCKRKTQMLRTLEREAVALLADHLEQSAAIKGQRARYLARKMLAADDPTAQNGLLHRVQTTYGTVVAQSLDTAFWWTEIDRVILAAEQQEQT